MESISAITLIFAGITLLILYAVIKLKQISSRIRAEFAAQNLPCAEVPNIFFIAFQGKRQELLEHEMVQKYGKVFGANFMSSKTIFIAEPEIAQLVLSKEFTSFTNRRKLPFEDKLFSILLSTAEDETWKRIRSIVTPTFSAGKLRNTMKPRIDDCVKTLLGHLEKSLSKSNIINIKELIGCFTMDTIIQVAFGTKVDSLSDPNNPIILNAKSVFSTDLSLGRIALIFFLLFSPKNGMKLANYLGMNKWINFFNEFSIKIIREKRQKLKQQNAQKANNFLEMLLEAEKEHEAMLESNGKATGTDESHASTRPIKFLSTDEMIAQCLQFWLAGYDTTTTAISLTCYLLAQNPSVQEHLYEEIVANLRKLKSENEAAVDTIDPLELITFEWLNKLEYLNAVICEALRLYPPVAIERAASHDITLETEAGSVRVDIKKGDILHFPVFSIHRDPQQFPDPETFKPERFIGEPRHHKYAYLPFGSGPRNCVARSLALLEAKMAILNVVYHYKLSTCKETKIPMQFYNNGQILIPREVVLWVESR